MKGSTHVTPVPIIGTALVTGGTAGIGYAFARALAARGCDLVLVARNEQRLNERAEELRMAHDVCVQTIVADLGVHEDVETVVRRLEDDATPVDILVNNAGSGLHVPLTVRDMTPHEQAINVMLRAVLVLGGAAARSMESRKSGIIVNVASVASQVAMGNYSAIKAWVATWSESLSLEMEGTGVQVLTLMPGWVRTEFHERAKIKTSKIPPFLWLNADDLVADCFADLERGRTWSVPSKRFKVVSWCADHLPRVVVRRATALVRKGRR